MDLAVPLLVAVVISVLAPSVLLLLQGRQKRADQVIQWARDDLVAARAEAASRAVVEANQATTAVVVATAAEQREILGSIKDTGEVTHLLVNSNLTKAIASEYDATVAQLASLRELADFKTAMGHPASPDTIHIIAMTAAKVAKLAADLEERAKQQAVVDAKLAGEATTAELLRSTLESAGVEISSPPAEP